VAGGSKQVSRLRRSPVPIPTACDPPCLSPFARNPAVPTLVARNPAMPTLVARNPAVPTPVARDLAAPSPPPPPSRRPHPLPTPSRRAHPRHLPSRRRQSYTGEPSLAKRESKSPTPPGHRSTSARFSPLLRVVERHPPALPLPPWTRPGPGCISEYAFRRHPVGANIRRGRWSQKEGVGTWWRWRFSPLRPSSMES
jgi:hypothetical protein